jgi:vitamin B12 transporter
MVLRLACFCKALCCATTLLAQPDTTVLAPLEIVGLRILPYAIGAKTHSVKIENSTQTLADKLASEASLYFKNYGNQQLSTISFRGTTSSQTALLWNGINVNSPTLGLTDFSLVPLFLFDEVTLLCGASSALGGTDAIGGSVSLHASPIVFKSEIKTTLHQHTGSFGRLAGGLKFSMGSNRWFSPTRLYGSTIQNDFPYTSPAVGYRRVQHNASVRNEGVSQQVAFKINEDQQLTAEAVYVHNFRHNQPDVTNFDANETTQDKQLRLALHYDNTSTLGVVRATLAHARDKQVYTNDKSSTVYTSQWTGLLNVDKLLNYRTSIRWGGSIGRFQAKGENYPSQLRDNRLDAFASVRYQILKGWLMSVNVRQALFNTQYAPFTPSIGTEVKLLENNTNTITLRSQVGRAFRIPTLNDRFWQPGGNPDLKAEDAQQQEAGLQWVRKKEKSNLTVDVTTYQTKARNMIVWQPDGNNVWRPENLQRVRIHGIETSLSIHRSFGEYKATGSAAYSFTKSTNKKNTVAEHLNKQLPYVPLHSARWLVAISRWQWKLEASNNFTSARYTALDNTTQLAPFFISDATLEKSFAFRAADLSAAFQAFNILGVYYENLNNHAMPGRNYSLRISLTLNDLSK